MTARISEDVDGGYAWVVLAANFLNLSLNGGASYLFGLFYPHFLDTFEASDMITVSVASAQSICIFAVGLLAGSLSDTFGCRLVIFLGTIMTVFGLIVAALAPNIIVLYLGYGIIAGFGIGLHFVPIVVSIQIYFKKRMAIAMGIACAGVGFGTFIFSPILTALKDYYGWRGTMLMYAAIFSHSIVFAALVRPIPKHLNCTKDAKFERESKEKNEVIQELHNENDTQVLQRDGKICVSHKLNPHRGSITIIQENRHMISKKEDISKCNGQKPVLDTSKVHLNGWNEKSSSHMNISSKCEDYLSDTIYQSHNDMSKDFTLIRDSLTSRNGSHCRLSYLYSTTSIHSLSLGNIGSVKTHTSDTDLRDTEDGISSSNTLSHRLKESMKSMFDAKLYVNVYVVLFQIVSILMALTHFTLYTFTPRNAESHGLNSYEVSLVLSMVGCGDIVGRIFGGLLGFKLDNTLVYIVTTVWCGSFYIICSVSSTFNALVATTFLLATGIGCYVSISCTTLVFYVGEAKFARVFGFLLIGNMIGSGIHAPLGVMLYRLTQSYGTVYTILAVFPFISSLILVLIFILRKLHCSPVYADEVRMEVYVHTNE